MVAQDAPIPETWATLTALVTAGNRIIFVTGRNEAQRVTTYDWLMEPMCEHRRPAQLLWKETPRLRPMLFMRYGDLARIPSADMKQILLEEVRSYGYDPKLAFEDRKTDTEMWRRNGLLCCQVAEGNY